MYLCGPTILTSPHIGQLRSAVNFDIMHRWLRYRGYEVTLCRNITDVEDKILHQARNDSVEWWQIAEPSYRSFLRTYDALGCLPPTVEPRASGHIPETIDLIQRLMDRGHAYATSTGVYFDVNSFPEYGALSRQKLEQLNTPRADNANGKRNPADFALWKAAKPGEPIWNTPWVGGRPGWHIQCSAMAAKYLGSEFDIHAGGADLIFPHNENEFAQSRAAGLPSARYWMHNGRVTSGGEKVRKSIGNPLSILEIQQYARMIDLRFYLGIAHYRSDLEFTLSSVQQASSAFSRIERFLCQAVEVGGLSRQSPSGEVPQEFAKAMDRDLATPAATSSLYAAVRLGLAALKAGDMDKVRRSYDAVRSMLDVLGVDPFNEHWRRDEQGSLAGDITSQLVRLILRIRAEARSRGDFVLADEIRGYLDQIGVRVADGKVE